MINIFKTSIVSLGSIFFSSSIFNSFNFFFFFFFFKLKPRGDRNAGGENAGGENAVSLVFTWVKVVKCVCAVVEL